MAKTTLLPCPFCQSRRAEYDGMAVACLNEDCLAVGPIKIGRKASEQAWNEAPRLPQIQPKVKP